MEKLKKQCFIYIALYMHLSIKHLWELFFIIITCSFDQLSAMCLLHENYTVLLLILHLSHGITEDNMFTCVNTIVIYYIIRLIPCLPKILTYN